MILKEIKKIIYAALDIDIPENPSAGSVYSNVEKSINYIIDSVSKKAAAYTKCIKRAYEISFLSSGVRAEATLPEDFLSFSYILCGGRSYGRENFEIISGKIISERIPAGIYTLVYYAFPATLDKDSDENTELSLPDEVCYAVAYGAAMEISSNIYPDDVRRYMRLATEYDERMANIITSSSEASCIADRFFAGARGVFI
ncbi:MAG: hypothetical protein ACI4QR_06885 [Eubacteriales bacterium]